MIYDNAKPRLLNCMPCVLKLTLAPTFLACLRAHVPTGLTCFHAHISTCLSCLRAHLPMHLECLPASRVKLLSVLMYSRVNVPCKFTCSSVNMAWVICLTWFPWTRGHLPTCLSSSVRSFIASFFSLTI